MQGQQSAGGTGTLEHPGLEDLAAYVDGKLSSAERTRVARHLADCEECFDVFAETVRLTAEEREAAGEEDAKLLPFRDRVRIWRQSLLRPGENRRWASQGLVAVAAVLLVAVGLGLGYRAWVAPPEISRDAMVELLAQAGRDVSRQTYVGVTFRGPGDEEADLDSTREAFQVGVLDVDLHLCLKLEDWKCASERSRGLANLFEAMPFGQEDAALFRKSRETMETDSLPAATLRAMDDALASESLEPVHLSFGRWAEAALISARVGQKDFFRSRQNRRFLELLIENPTRLDPDHGENGPTKIDPEVRPLLAKVRDVWEGEKLETTELASVATSLQEIIHFYHQRISDDFSRRPEVPAGLVVLTAQRHVPGNLRRVAARDL